jgi:hypothetical protein
MFSERKKRTKEGGIMLDKENNSIQEQGDEGNLT